MEFCPLFSSILDRAESLWPSHNQGELFCCGAPLWSHHEQLCRTWNQFLTEYFKSFQNNHLNQAAAFFWPMHLPPTTWKPFPFHALYLESVRFTCARYLCVLTWCRCALASLSDDWPSGLLCRLRVCMSHTSTCLAAYKHTREQVRYSGIPVHL